MDEMGCALARPESDVLAGVAVLVSDDLDGEPYGVDQGHEVAHGLTTAVGIVCADGVLEAQLQRRCGGDQTAEVGHHPSGVAFAVWPIVP